MKRGGGDGDRVGNGVRPPGWSSRDDELEEEGSSPPAKKLLRNLLEKEIQKAIRDLNEEVPANVKSRGHRAISLIPEFDPEGEEHTVNSWLKKIDQLGEIHGWDNNTKAFYLQDKLRGQARKWYNRLDNYNYTWEEWKQMLIRAFPKHHDFGNLLDEMMQRKKLATETMKKYYQDKVALCFRCKLSDSATVSCIIRGLPSTLQLNARAFQCERPDELYEGFLCVFDNYNHTSASDTLMMSKEYHRQTAEKKAESVNPEVDPCPRCKKTGHMLRNCTQPDLRSCFKCGKQGHISSRCPTTLTSARFATL